MYYISQFVKDQSKIWACMVVTTRVITIYQSFKVNLVLTKSIVFIDNQVYKLKINRHGMVVHNSVMIDKI